MSVTIQLRRDSAANWVSVNPTLAAGELGFELDTGKFKIGNGFTAWNSQVYAGGGSIVVGEVPSGTLNGTNTTFTTSHNYVPGTIEVFRNGLREHLSIGFTEASANTIAFSTAPLSSDDVLVNYTAQ